jgi:hypothetical protein
MNVTGKKSMIVRILLTAEVQQDEDLLNDRGELNKQAINTIKKNVMEVMEFSFTGVSFNDASVMYKEE